VKDSDEVIGFMFDLNTNTTYDIVMNDEGVSFLSDDATPRPQISFTCRALKVSEKEDR
jgi:hypothetical protein